MENKNKKILTLMIILTALLIGIGGVFAYKIYSNNSTRNVYDERAHGDFLGVTGCNSGEYRSSLNGQYAYIGTYKGSTANEAKSACETAAPSKVPSGQTWTCTDAIAYCNECNANYYLKNGSCKSCDDGKTSPIGSTSADDCTNSSTPVSETKVAKPTKSKCRVLSYNGLNQELVNTASTGYHWTSSNAINAGDHNVTAVLENGYAWPDGTKNNVIVTCSISKETPLMSLNSTGGTINQIGGTTSFEITLKTKEESGTLGGTITISVDDSSVASVSTTSESVSGVGSVGTTKTVTVTAKKAGTTKIRVSYSGDNNHNVTELSWNLNVSTGGIVEIPTAEKKCKKGLVYTGSEIDLTFGAGTGYTFSHQPVVTPGNYTVTATLQDGFKWADNTSTTKQFVCSVGKATPSLSVSTTYVTVKTGENIVVPITVKSGAVNGEILGSLSVKNNDLSIADTSFTVMGDVSATFSGTTKNLTISGLKEGSTKIIISYDKATNYTSYNDFNTIEIHVVVSRGDHEPEINIPGCDININQTTNKLKPGDTYTLTATSNNFKNFTWSVSGQATITSNNVLTVSSPAQDGSEIVVTVKEKYIDKDGAVSYSQCSDEVTFVVDNGVTNVKCDPGQYLPKNSETCTLCQENSYCPGGLFSKSSTSDQGIYACEAIPGTRKVYVYSDGNRSSETDCYANVAAGEYIASGSKYRCSVGSYSKARKVHYGSSDLCTPCEVGKTTSDVGSTSAEACNITVETVDACKPGTYLPANTIKCVECPVGSYCPGPVNPSTTKYVKKTYDQGINSCPYANVTSGNAYDVANRKYTSKAGAKSENECYIKLNCDRVNMSSPPQIIACSEFSGSTKTTTVYYGQSGSACATSCKDTPNTCLPKLNGVKYGSKGSTINLTLSDEKNDYVSNYVWSISGPAELGKRTNDSTGIMSIKINSDAKNGDEIVVTASSGNCVATHTIKVGSGGGNDTCYNSTTVNVTTLEVQPEEPNREYKTKFKVDEYTVLKASVTGKSPLCGTNVTWQSLDESIAIISDDDTNDIHKLQDNEIKVIGKKFGRVKIRATAVNGNVYGEIEVEVVKQDEDITCVSPTGITVTANPTNIKIGERTIATAKLTGDGTYCDSKVVWESSDTSVATVDQNGNVTGAGEGAVAITARAVSGGKSDSVIIYVGSTLPDVPKTSLGISTIVLITSILIGAFGLYLFYYLKKKQINN